MLFLVNANDHTVKTAPVLDVARAWNSRGAPVAVYEIPDSLGLPHNVDRSDRPRGNAGHGAPGAHRARARRAAADVGRTRRAARRVVT